MKEMQVLILDGQRRYRNTQGYDLPSNSVIPNANVSHHILPNQQGPEKDAMILQQQKLHEGIKPLTK